MQWGGHGDGCGLQAWLQEQEAVCSCWLTRRQRDGFLSPCLPVLSPAPFSSRLTPNPWACTARVPSFPQLVHLEKCASGHSYLYLLFDFICGCVCTHRATLGVLSFHRVVLGARVSLPELATGAFAAAPSDCPPCVLLNSITLGIAVKQP